jgi:hypothetical protein
MGPVVGTSASPMRASIKSWPSPVPAEHTTMPRWTREPFSSVIASAAEAAANCAAGRPLARYAGCTTQRPISTVSVRRDPSLWSNSENVFSPRICSVTHEKPSISRGKSAHSRRASSHRMQGYGRHRGQLDRRRRGAPLQL